MLKTSPNLLKPEYFTFETLCKDYEEFFGIAFLSLALRGPKARGNPCLLPLFLNSESRKGMDYRAIRCAHSSQ